VRANNADYGVALDGDADRLQLVDAQGRLYNGDELLYLMAADRLARGDVVSGVAGTLMTNMAVEQALKEQGVGFVRAKVGDRYVLEALNAKGWQLGGESSGHLLALDKHTTGDGLVSALQVLQACVRSKKTIAQWLESVKLFPQVMINVRLQPGQDWKSNAKLPGEQAAVEKAAGQRRPRADPSQRYRAPGARHGRGQECGHGQQLCRASGRGGQGQLKLCKP
jgi:phosphoglucosamine mutase